MNYESDPSAFPADAYTVDGQCGVAWHVLGWHTEPDEDTEWSGYEVQTGDVVAVMVGDDCHVRFGLDDIHPLDRADYCGECGQIGCCHDGYDRD